MVAEWAVRAVEYSGSSKLELRLQLLRLKLLVLIEREAVSVPYDLQ